MAVVSNQSPFTEGLSLSSRTGLTASQTPVFTFPTGSLEVRIINYFIYFLGCCVMSPPPTQPPRQHPC